MDGYKCTKQKHTPYILICRGLAAAEVGEEGKYAYQRRECGRVATPSRAAAAELSGPAGAGPRDGGERGRGVDGLGDGGAGARGQGAGARGRRRVWSPVLGDGAGAVDGAGDWGLGAPRLEWRLRFGARAREKKGKIGAPPSGPALTWRC